MPRPWPPSPRACSPVLARRRAKGTRRHTRTGARTRCARCGPATRGAAAEARRPRRSSRLPMRGRRVARGELETVPERRRITANPSRQPPGDPGRFTISVAPRRPAMPRESSACGVRAMASARTASARPGVSRSTTDRVASGVTSRGANPVPPVVRTTATPESASSRIADAIRSASSETIRRSTSNPSSRRRLSNRSPDESSRTPALTPSETVRTAAFTQALRLLDQLHLVDDHSLVDRLRHVVHGERGHRDCDERLHLDARLGRRSAAASISTESRPR